MICSRYSCAQYAQLLDFAAKIVDSSRLNFGFSHRRRIRMHVCSRLNHNIAAVGAYRLTMISMRQKRLSMKNEFMFIVRPTLGPLVA